MNIKIKRAAATDASEIIALMEEHASYEHANFDPTCLDEKLIVALKSAPPKLVVYLAEVNSKVVGYCALTREFSSWKCEEYVHLDCLYIVEEMRGLHIGQKLMDAAMRFAQKQGIYQLQWQTPEWNKGAVHFYEKMGAHSQSKLRFTYWISR